MEKYIVSEELEKAVKNACCFTHYLMLAFPLKKRHHSAYEIMQWLKNGDDKNPLWVLFSEVWKSYHNKLINI